MLKRIPGPRFSSSNYAASASCCLATVARPHSHWRYSAALQHCNFRLQELLQDTGYIAFRRLIELGRLILSIYCLISLLHLLNLLQFAGVPRVCGWPQPSAAVISHQHLNQDIRLTRNLFVPGPARFPAW